MAERQCCPFLSFGLEFTGDQFVLTVRAPEHAQELAAALFDHAEIHPS